jgi:hypothetical protein
VAANLFQVPIAIVSLVDHDSIWFKSHHGVDLCEVGREPGLCASAIFSKEVYHIRDAVDDVRALANPLVERARVTTCFAVQCRLEKMCKCSELRRLHCSRIGAEACDSPDVLVPNVAFESDAEYSLR